MTVIELGRQSRSQSRIFRIRAIAQVICLEAVIGLRRHLRAGIEWGDPRVIEAAIDLRERWPAEKAGV